MIQLLVDTLSLAPEDELFPPFTLAYSWAITALAEQTGPCSAKSPPSNAPLSMP